MSRTIGVRTLVLAFGSAVALAASASTAASLASSPTRATAATAPASLTAKASRYGKVLFDGKGRALYLFARDRGNRSSCYGGCAQVWPPYIVTRAPKALGGVSQRLIGTTRRHDGTLEVTYAGHPLYRFTGDKSPGEITCQGVSNFGGVWLVVTPRGTAVH